MDRINSGEMPPEEESQPTEKEIEQVEEGDEVIYEIRMQMQEQDPKKRIHSRSDPREIS